MIEYQVDNGVGIMALNRPKANAYTLEMLKELDEAILAARLDENVHVIVLRGKGEKFFSAGADIEMLTSHSTSYRYYFSLYGHETLTRLENTPKLVIAALNGHTVGGGLEIALACDIRIAKRDGGRLGLAEVNLGVLPGMGGTQRLPRWIGRAQALEMAATGRQLSFEEAHELGLVNHIYESENFFEQVLDYARQFVPPNKASFAVGRIKRAIHAGLDGSLSEGLALEREVLLEAFLSEDAAEGLAANRTRRTPQFKGR
ncbi:MAG: enoyl-CoA hydratase/isomerase family protein [Acidobacteria bacterium]|nr:enoyl-CoA hydratase/isomerase family protein [Acidobacteriota bacterium]MBI3658588.1 enoyl-CoA hydratase/isomerase family protein [Acidobacteriota bacterium]